MIRVIGNFALEIRDELLLWKCNAERGRGVMTAVEKWQRIE